MNSAPKKNHKGGRAIAEQMKYQLKSHNMDYKDLAGIWAVSESSVKRIMSQFEFTVERIEQFCDAIELDIGDFFKSTNFESNTQVYTLTDDQELKLSKDLELTNIYMLIEEGRTAQEIMKTHSISNEKLTKYLLQLDRMGLIELQAHNKIVRKFYGQLRFKKDGPIAKILLQQMKESFLQSAFSKEDQYLTFIMLYFAPGMLAQYKLRFQKLIKDMIYDSEQNRNHPNREEFGLLVAARAWPSPVTTAIPKRKSIR